MSLRITMLATNSQGINRTSRERMYGITVSGIVLPGWERKRINLFV